MEKNIPLLRKVFEHISEHPEEWDQRWWRSVVVNGARHWFASRRLPEEGCRTAHCYAGWAAAMTGATWADRPVTTTFAGVVGTDDARMMNAYVDAEPEDAPGVVTLSGHVAVQYRAQRVLGLTWPEAAVLFHAENRLPDIKRLLTEWGALE